MSSGPGLEATKDWVPSPAHNGGEGEWFLAPCLPCATVPPHPAQQKPLSQFPGGAPSSPSTPMGRGPAAKQRPGDSRGLRRTYSSLVNTAPTTLAPGEAGRSHSGFWGPKPRVTHQCSPAAPGPEGTHSATRCRIFPQHPEPVLPGQVWILEAPGLSSGHDVASPGSPLRHLFLPYKAPSPEHSKPRACIYST